MAFLLCSGFAQEAVSVSDCSSDMPITLIDPFLQREIKLTLGINTGDSEPFTCGDLLGLTKLEIPVESNVNARITSLSGLEYAVNLEELALLNAAPGYDAGHYISSLEPLASLEKLRRLEIFMGSIEDLSPLANLNGLEYLSLTKQQISDISPLKTLKNLAELDLSHNSISDISALHDVDNLRILSLFDNRVSDTSPLSGLKKLEYVDLRRNALSSISLRDVPVLKGISLGENAISDLSFVNDLGAEHITALDLNNNLVHDLTPLIDSPILRSDTKVYLDANCLDLEPSSSAAKQLELLRQKIISVHAEAMIQGCVGLQAEASNDSEVVEFKDSLLIKALVEATGHYDLTSSTLAGLTQLDLSIQACVPAPTRKYLDFRCIENLEGLEQVTALQDMILYIGKLTDFPVLPNSASLQRVLLYDGNGALCIHLQEGQVIPSTLANSLSTYDNRLEKMNAAVREFEAMGIQSFMVNYRHDAQKPFASECFD
jgi:Leucine-rich repeat (LRR) protein